MKIKMGTLYYQCEKLLFFSVFFQNKITNIYLYFSTEPIIDLLAFLSVFSSSRRLISACSSLIYQNDDSMFLKYDLVGHDGDQGLATQGHENNLNSLKSDLKKKKKFT